MRPFSRILKGKGAFFMSKRKRILSLAVSCGIVWGAAGISYLLTGRTAMEGYSQLRQPPLAPPGWVFPVVWSVLYTLMGVSAWMVWEKHSPEALRPYGAQLILNVLWTPLFFRLRLYWAAFAVLCALWAAILWMVMAFSRVSRRAAALQLPYLLWVTFAGYLNGMIALWN